MSQFLSLVEHAADLGVSVKTVRNAVCSGSWPAKTVRLGRRRLVSILEHQRLVEALLRDGFIPLDGTWTSTILETEHTPSAPNSRGPGRPRMPLLAASGRVKREP